MWRQWRWWLVGFQQGSNFGVYTLVFPIFFPLLRKGMDKDLSSPTTPINTTQTNTELPEGEAADCDENVVIGVSGRKLTSAVWKHFEQVNISGEMKAKCTGCKKLFVGDGKKGTTHLMDHLKRCIKVKNFRDVKQQILQASGKGSSTVQIGGKYKFSQQVSRNELVNMIVDHEYPLAMVDHIGFRKYSHSLNPEFKIISRNTVKADILRDYKQERHRLEKILAQNKSRVAITTDMWTSKNQRKGYMAVTAHYIDDDWVLQNQLIRFMYVPCPHNKYTISKSLELDCKTRWNSCYEMLRNALLYKDAFIRLECKVGKGGKEKFKLPSKEEWKMASDICDRLALFSRATEAFSGRKYPIANLYFQKVCEIRLNLRRWLSCGNPVIESMAKAMIEKFDKYWEVVNGMLSVASILDPRRKLECASFYFNIIYGEGGKSECDRVQRILNDLVNEYGQNCEENSYPFSHSSNLNDNGKRPLDDLNDVEGLWEKLFLLNQVRSHVNVS